jgi:CRISPR-associated protein Csb1
MNLTPLLAHPRLLIEVDLAPVAGTRFQPTGFPDLQAATYQTPDGKDMLLVESAQSMANRLETVCWDEAEEKPVAALSGLPFVEVSLPDGSKTNSLLEAHRLNSPYLVNAEGFETIATAVGFVKDRPFDRQKLVSALFKFDPNSLIHGIFLEKIGGVVRLPRALTAFIEASDVRVAASGGVKVDRVQPESGGDSTAYGKASEGYGNVPFHRDEFTGHVTAFFNLDLSLIASFRLAPEARELLIALSLFKIERFLTTGLRLRTACDFVEIARRVTQPVKGFSLPTATEINTHLTELLAANAKNFASPRVTALRYSESKAKARKTTNEAK